MATHLAELCALLVLEEYGELSTQVFEALLRHGRTNIATLIQLTNLTPRQVRHGLTVLIQQHLVLHTSPQGESTTYYTADWNGAYNLMRAGKVISIVEDRYGSGTAQVVSNLFQLGHARVGDLEDAYKFTTTDRNAIDSAAEHINGEGLQNGMVNGHTTTKGQNRKISSRPQLHAALYRLLESGLIARVRERTFLSAADKQNEAEVIVKREQFPDGKITGPKAKLNFAQAVDSLKRKWRDEDDQIGGDAYKGTVTTSNGRPHKRIKTNGNMTNGTSRHYEDDVEEEEIQVSLERDVVLKVNYEKACVAMRSLQLEQFAVRFFGETTAKVYGALLTLLEKKLHRCRDDLEQYEDEEAESEAQPSASTLELLDLLDPSLDLESTIASPDHLTNGFHPKSEPGINIKYEDADDYSASSVKSRNKRLTQIEQHLSLVAEHPRGFVDKIGTRGKGEWRVNFPALTKRLQRAEIENIINARFGSLAARLARMLSKKGKLEEKQVCNFSLLRAKDVRAVLTSMQAVGLVETQEVPKDLARQPSRATYLWYFDHERCCEVLLADTYKAMCRLIQRIDKQREEVQEVIDKAERTDVVGHEETYLTNSDKAHLRRWRESEEKLLTQLNRQDDMVALFRDF